MKITEQAIAVLISLALLLPGLAACSPASQSSSSSPLDSTSQQLFCDGR